MTGFFTTVNGSRYRPRGNDNVEEVRNGVDGLNFRQLNDHWNGNSNDYPKENCNDSGSHNQRYHNIELRGSGQQHNNNYDNDRSNCDDNYLPHRSNSNRNESNGRPYNNVNSHYVVDHPSGRSCGEFSDSCRPLSPNRYGMTTMSACVTSSHTDLTEDLRTGLEDVDEQKSEQKGGNQNSFRSNIASSFSQRQHKQLQQFGDRATSRLFQPSVMNARRMTNAGYNERASAFEPTARQPPSRMADHESPNVLRQPQPFNSSDNGANTNGKNTKNDGRMDVQQNGPGRKPRREKFMPPEKTANELYDPATQIQRGSRFEELFSVENDNRVQVNGAGHEPPRVQRFDECEFSKEIMNNIRLMKYQVPTQIQKFVMPLILWKKRDIVGHASTGSGKTLAFFAPVIQKIQTFRHDNPQPAQLSAPYAPLAVVIAYTRELCQQLYNDARRLASNTGVTVNLSMGDMPMKDCIENLAAGCDIFVATIGRTKHYADEKIVRFFGHTLNRFICMITLSKVQFFIMDEVDSMVCKEKKQFDQLQSLVEQYDMNPAHRTLLFSATLSADAQAQMAMFIGDRAYFVYVGELNRVVETVNQKFYDVTKSRKRDFLLDLLIHESNKIPLPNNNFSYKPPKTIVFVAEKRMSDRLAFMLATSGFQVISLNADRTLKQRIMAIEKFSKGFYDVLVATDVSSRGMNFPEVEHVINYDLPRRQELTYVHRLGRTGRAGNNGRATSFFDPLSEDNEFVDFYVDALNVAGLTVPQFMREVQEFKSDYRTRKGRVFPSRDLGDRVWI